jgi:hypothetical protein
VRVLQPARQTLQKLTTFVPQQDTASVLAALHAAGAGEIGNYSACSFRVAGTGTFTPNEGAKPTIGSLGKMETVAEDRIELIFAKPRQQEVLRALKAAHPYEEVAYYLHTLENENQEVGSGVVGTLSEPMETMAFLQLVKKAFKTGCVRHTLPTKSLVQQVAVCGGAGSLLVPKAIQVGADVFISADFKYHEFFDAEGRITLADVGHYESEQYTKDLIAEVLREKFPTFAVNFSKTNTNPISYL